MANIANNSATIVMPSEIEWSLHKPRINDGCLQRTKGPSEHPEREPTCIICYEDLKSDDHTLTHSTCSHAAHADCLDPWLRHQMEDLRATAQDGICQGARCPMCQQPYSLLDTLELFCDKQAELGTAAQAMSSVALASAFQLLYDIPVDHDDADLFLAHYPQVLHVERQPSINLEGEEFLTSIFNGSAVSPFGLVAKEWFEAQIIPKVLDVLDMQLRVLKAKAETQLVKEVGLLQVLLGLEAQFFSFRVALWRAIVPRPEHLQYARSELALAKVKFDLAVMLGANLDTAQADFKAKVTQMEELLKAGCLTAIKDQVTMAKLRLATMERLEMVEHYNRTGKALPPV